MHLCFLDHHQDKNGFGLCSPVAKEHMALQVLLKKVLNVMLLYLLIMLFLTASSLLELQDDASLDSVLLLLCTSVLTM